MLVPIVLANTTHVFKQGLQDEVISNDEAIISCMTNVLSWSKWIDFSAHLDARNISDTTSNRRNTAIDAKDFCTKY
jgi:hypothetical protein